MLLIIFIVLLLIGLAFWYRPARSPAPGGSDGLEQVELGGVRQWISIRGADPKAPVLLFLHGGPGSANIAKLRLQVPELEQHFVIVNWDQRGAGKSASIGFDYSTLSIGQMVSDAHELVTILKARFGVEKIYLMGFSWGTALGLELAARYPDDFYAYIGVSQIVSTAESEKLSLEYVQAMAVKRGNTQAFTELAGIDPSYQGDSGFRQVMIERKWLLRYGGVYRTTNSYAHEIVMLFRASEYSFVETALWPLRSSASLRQMWPQVMGIDFTKSIQEVHVPVYFFLGRYDQNVPAQPAERYFEQLNAPFGKHLVWFENSAHDLFFDEPDKLVQETLVILDLQK